MKTINLQKFGFIRREDLDFRDDGTSFKGYEYCGMTFTYARAYGEVFISGHPGDGIPSSDGTFRKFLPYKVYSKIEGYSHLDDLNGVDPEKVTEESIWELKKWVIKYVAEAQRIMEGK